MLDNDSDSRWTASEPAAPFLPRRAATPASTLLRTNRPRPEQIAQSSTHYVGSPLDLFHIICDNWQNNKGFKL
jgi:hypothetical protein